MTTLMQQGNRRCTADKHQWKNLYHSFRWMRRFCTEVETLTWIGFYSPTDRRIIERVL